MANVTSRSAQKPNPLKIKELYGNKDGTNVTKNRP